MTLQVQENPNWPLFYGAWICGLFMAVNAVNIDPREAVLHLKEVSRNCSYGDLNVIQQVVTVDQLNPEATGALILLHGTGGDADEFRSKINHLMQEKAVFPHIRIIYPTAPMTRYSPSGGVLKRTWYGISNLTMKAVEVEADIERVGSDLLTIIESQVKCGIPRNRIAVAGFSRGGAMAFHLGFGLAQDIAAVGVMSSFIPYSSSLYQCLRERNSNQILPVLLQQHGLEDRLVDIAAGKATFEELMEFGVQGKFVPLDGQGHELTSVELNHLFKFISELIPENAQ